MIDGEEFEAVDDFTYLGSNISSENSVQKEISKDDMNKLDIFQTKCLRRTCNIFWPNKISNEDLYRRTNSSPISTQIQKHRLKWLGHVLRMPQDYIPKVALRWTPTGKRNRGRPKTTWRRTIKKNDNLTAHQLCNLRRLYQYQSKIYSTFLSKITKF